MADPLPPELAGKGKRVAGVFVFMIGASIILDTHALSIGVPLMAAGVVLFGRGMVEARTHDPLVASAHDVTPEAQR